MYVCVSDGILKCVKKVVQQLFFFVCVRNEDLNMKFDNL